MSRGEKYIAAVLGLFAAAWIIGCASTSANLTNGVPNLRQVEPGVWRGGQPATDAAWAYLRGLGLTNDLKLNTGDEGSDAGAIKAGFFLSYLPMDGMDQLVGPINSADLSNEVALVRPGTFVHCEHGQDRTGLVVGLHRLREGWTSDAAWSEMITNGYHQQLHGLTEAFRKACLEGKPR